MLDMSTFHYIITESVNNEHTRNYDQGIFSVISFDEETVDYLRSRHLCRFVKRSIVVIKLKYETNL